MPVSRPSSGAPRPSHSVTPGEASMEFAPHLPFPRHPAYAPGMQRILVVDDDPDITAVMRELLVTEGYRVFVALSITAAHDILAAFRVGLEP